MKHISEIVCFIILGCFLHGCLKKHEADLNEIKIAKTVPPLMLQTTDARLHWQQDTLYYQQQFFSGYTYELQHEKDTLALKSYFNGVQEGFQKEWYSNGKIKEERFYINGKKEAVQRGWWPNGKPRFYFTAYNDEYAGQFKEWMENGLLVKWFHYQNGKEEGSQKLWWSDGKIRANYVIKQGRKFGLLGYRICENPYDSVVKK